MEHPDIELAEAEMELAQKRVALLRARAAQGAAVGNAIIQDAPPSALDGGQHEAVDAGAASATGGLADAEQIARHENDVLPPTLVEPPTLAEAEGQVAPGQAAAEIDAKSGSVNDEEFVEAAPMDITNNDDDAAMVAPVQDEEGEVDEVDEALNGDEQGAATQTLAATTDADEHEGGGPMNRPTFMRRVFNWAGLVWQDSAGREGVDTEAAQYMVGEAISFEHNNYDERWGRAPVPVLSARQWASKGRMPAKIYKAVPEANFTALVARMWRTIRGLNFHDVRRMNGRFGLIGIIRAIYQANALEVDAEEDFRIIMNDVGRALQALRYPNDATNGSLLSVLSALDDAVTAEATAVLDRLADADDVIEIEDGDDESPPSPPKKKKDDDYESPPSPPKKKKDDDDEENGGGHGKGKANRGKASGSSAGSKTNGKRKAGSAEGPKSSSKKAKVSPNIGHDGAKVPANSSHVDYQAIIVTLHEGSSSVNLQGPQEADAVNSVQETQSLPRSGLTCTADTVAGIMAPLATSSLQDVEMTSSYEPAPPSSESQSSHSVRSVAREASLSQMPYFVRNPDAPPNVLGRRSPFQASSSETDLFASMIMASLWFCVAVMTWATEELGCWLMPATIDIELGER
ncbi:hypothetical protein PENSPDRAFT_694616 [Peniophora sp. CONT]|nr:hypothetical protein PENSPDRAFT_694616 [Peniophora sp. CONT]